MAPAYCMRFCSGWTATGLPGTAGVILYLSDIAHQDCHDAAERHRGDANKRIGRILQLLQASGPLEDRNKQKFRTTGGRTRTQSLDPLV